VVAGMSLLRLATMALSLSSPFAEEEVAVWEEEGRRQLPLAALGARQRAMLWGEGGERETPGRRGVGEGGGGGSRWLQLRI
jgi:hypothetical protein